MVDAMALHKSKLKSTKKEKRERKMISNEIRIEGKIIYNAQTLLVSKPINFNFSLNIFTFAHITLIADFLPFIFSQMVFGLKATAFGRMKEKEKKNIDCCHKSRNKHKVNKRF